MRAFTGRNLYNHRNAGASHVRGATDIITTSAPAAPAVAAAEDGDHQHQHYLEEDEEDEYAFYDTEEEEEAGRSAEEEEDEHQHQQAGTSGAMLLAMARPAKTRQRRCPPVMTDGEMFEIVEIDGRLVALDEDGWEILPDENCGGLSFVF